MVTSFYINSKFLPFYMFHNNDFDKKLFISLNSRDRDSPQKVNSFWGI